MSSNIFLSLLDGYRCWPVEPSALVTVEILSRVLGHCAR